MTTIPSPEALGTEAGRARAARHPLSAPGWSAVAGLASIGAGAIHAAAIGVHAEHRAAALTFVVLAALQIGWGALALVRSGRFIAAAGIALGAGAVGGFAVAKLWGFGFIAGLDVAEPVQTADGLAAGLAAAVVALLGLDLWSARAGRAPARPPLLLAAVGLTAVSVVGMVAGGTHSHAGDHDGGGHAHGGGTGGETVVVTAQEPTYVVPFDPTEPIDFSGVPGVSAEQQAWAENVVGATLLLLPQWADPEHALANGFHSIGDGLTGTEHFVNDAFIDDDVIFDPTRPESLVWDTTSGERRLVAAMYMLPRGTPLAEAPDLGGPLMQWHIHDNLCYTPSGIVAGLTDGNGECRPGLILPEPTPMVHVWLEPQACGPFSALEGIGGGQIAPGEEVLCNHAHGTG